MKAISTVEDEVRDLVRRRGLDPVADPAAVRRLVDEVISDYDERSVSGALPLLVDVRQTARAVFDAVAGFGRCRSTSTTRPSRRSGSTSGRLAGSS